MPAKDPKKYASKHYQANKAQYKARCARARQRNREFVEEVKKRSVCLHCGCDDFRCLCFHHEDPAVKTHEVSEMINRSFSIARIQVEIDKCIVLCANCHRIVHYEHGYR